MRERRQGLVAGKTAGYDDVSSVEQKLQDAGEHERDGKPEQLSGQRSVAHVDLVGLCFHNKVFLPDLLCRKRFL